MSIPIFLRKIARAQLVPPTASFAKRKLIKGMKNTPFARSTIDCSNIVKLDVFSFRILERQPNCDSCNAVQDNCCKCSHNCKNHSENMNNHAFPCRESGDFLSLVVHDVACFEKLRITACYICCVHFSVIREA